ncbi:MAG: serine/threonine-protein kinase [Myxococcaceae bacterium]|nr:serine/threonine-protein kinase [Myxococcaceae bacterium]
MDTLTTSPILQLKDPLVGSRLGEYEVLEPIGEGGMGVVYRGIHPLIKKRVAIKVLKPGAATDAGHVKRLLAEAEAVNAIGHRNIIDIFGLGQLDDGRPYIVMEFLEGEPLDAYLRNNRALPLHEVLTLLMEVASPLAAAHAKGVIHRDLKPSNVFLCHQTEGGRYVKLLDFGLAKKAMEGGSSAQTSQHLVAGTPDYMAPEQARAMPVSARTDIYAFGAMAYEMLTGEVPYDGQTPMDVMMAHVSRPVPSVLKLVPSLPDELDGLVQRMMAKTPEDRPASMGDVRAELKAIVSKLSPTGTYQRLEPAPHRPSSSNETPVARPKQTQYVPDAVPLAEAAPSTAQGLAAVQKSRTPLMVGGLLSLAVAGGAVLLLQQPPPPPPPPLQAPTPVAVVKPPVIEPVVVPPAAVEPPPVVVSDEELVAPPRVGTPPSVKSRKAPTAEQLRLRVESMRKELERLTPPGEMPNPADLRILDRYKLESFNPGTDLGTLDRKLATFDREVLGPMRRH